MPLVHARTVETPPALDIRRDPDVPDAFWVAVLAHWGTVGPAPAIAILVPVERFLSDFGWLRRACQTYRVGIDWDDAARDLIEAFRQEGGVLAPTAWQGGCSPCRR